LLRFFGEHWNNASAFGIPVVDEVQKIGDVEPRATVGNSYTFIINELDAAVTLVNQDERDPALVNAMVVNALLARVYLYNKNYTKAIEHANTVINDSYSLLADVEYQTIFTGRQSSESIFELAFDSQNRSRYNGLTYSRPDALNTEVNFLAAEDLQIFFDSRSGDVRANLVDFDPDNNDTSIQPNGRTQKYRGESSEDSPAYILRLAEMYLIRAEALGFSNNGIDDINIIRNARGLADVNPANTNDFRFALLEEIRAEFNFEGHYFFDLARVGEIKPSGIVDTDAFRAILPIPLREITATNGAVEQNPEY
jgi:starch-binding outer membrane protein, SusD/RagB family